MATVLAAGEALPIDSLIALTPDGIASRILGKSKGGTLTLFAFDQGQSLSEHTAPFEAFVIVLDGQFRIVVEGRPAIAGAGTIVRLPASVPHAVDALTASRMMLVMLRE